MSRSEKQPMHVDRFEGPGDRWEEVRAYREAEPGKGGAYWHYHLEIAAETQGGEFRRGLGMVSFQNGPPREVGVNGITNELLLSIVADRLECFQQGEFACARNAMALDCVKDALYQLELRTKDRKARGVEGRYEK